VQSYLQIYELNRSTFQEALDAYLRAQAAQPVQPAQVEVKDIRENEATTTRSWSKRSVEEHQGEAKTEEEEKIDPETPVTRPEGLWLLRVGIVVFSDLENTEVTVHVSPSATIQQLLNLGLKCLDPKLLLRFQSSRKSSLGDLHWISARFSKIPSSSSSDPQTRPGLISLDVDSSVWTNVFKSRKRLSSNYEESYLKFTDDDELCYCWETSRWRAKTPREQLEERTLLQLGLYDGALILFNESGYNG